MSDNVINIPRESTMKALMEMQKMAVAGGANPGAADLCYKYMVAITVRRKQIHKGRNAGKMVRQSPRGRQSAWCLIPTVRNQLYSHRRINGRQRWLEMRSIYCKDAGAG